MRIFSQVSSSGFPTPVSGMSTRPGSNITADSSFPSSCSSALSTVEDRRMDELIKMDDGVRDQKIQGTKCFCYPNLSFEA